MTVDFPDLFLQSMDLLAKGVEPLAPWVRLMAKSDREKKAIQKELVGILPVDDLDLNGFKDFVNGEAVYHLEQLEKRLAALKEVFADVKVKPLADSK